ncbi:hypothetical protein EC847_11822 [Scandinavium goeteborgense]|uniref:Uncharacterized protein n=1 Tax=Scandinavium goeteborgense TaxID=1851514 RepID=A0A4R6E1D6_SCAGO|nr:hypothetical protein EC847_11822 [Scandinavium goeteborgense]
MFLRFRFDYCPQCGARTPLTSKKCQGCGANDPFGVFLARQQRQIVWFYLVLVLLFTDAVFQYVGIIDLNLLSSVFSRF